MPFHAVLAELPLETDSFVSMSTPPIPLVWAACSYLAAMGQIYLNWNAAWCSVPSISCSDKTRQVPDQALSVFQT